MAAPFFRISILGFFGVIVSARAHADEKPLWEAGLGIGALSFPDYRGSDQTRLYPVPVPYLVYRGDFLKADSNGVRGGVLNREYVELSVRVNPPVPVDSNNDHARHGMPNLRPTLEMGPSLDFHLWRSGDGRLKFGAVLPIRIPITIESSPQIIGWNFSPRFNLDIQDFAGHSGWNFGV